MSVLLWLGGYFLAALISTALLIRLRPEWLLVANDELKQEQEDFWGKPVTPDGFVEHLTFGERFAWEHWTRYAILHKNERERLRQDVEARVAGAMRPIEVQRPPAPPQWGALKRHTEPVLIFSPFVAALAYPVSAVIRASTRSVNNKTMARAELEKELANARKEVEELLRRDP